MPNTARSITPFSPSVSTTKTGVPGQPEPLHLVSRGKSRASNDALAWLATADVTPTGYRVGRFLANHARYATAADVRRRVTPGEVFTYWPQSKIATELGCSERQVSRGVRSLREAGALDVRQRVRPCEASYVLLPPVGSGVGSGVGSHTEPRTEPRTEEVQRTVGKPTTFPSKRADTGGQTQQQKLVAAVCDKLGFSVDFAGLEEFDGREHTEKQKLITRLIKAEARHDRRATAATNVAHTEKAPNKTGAPKARTATNVAPGGKPPPTAKKPNETGGQKTRTGDNSPRSGRLLREYGERLRSARSDAAAHDAPEGGVKKPTLSNSCNSAEIRETPDSDTLSDFSKSVNFGQTPDRASRQFQRVDGSWESLTS